MPEHYSPKHVLQLVLYELLREFLAVRAALLELASDELDSTPIDQIHDAWHPCRVNSERTLSAVARCVGTCR